MTDGGEGEHAQKARRDTSLFLCLQIILVVIFVVLLLVLISIFLGRRC
jgi:hypothetical protein